MSPYSAENIVVFGASGHAKVVIDVVSRASKYKIAGLIDSYKPIGTQLSGYSVLGSEMQLDCLMNELGFARGVVAIGDNFLRSELVQRIKAVVADFEFVSAVHPSAIVAEGTVIGPGTVVMAGVVINPGSAIGHHCIVNTRASIDHDCVLQDFSSVAPGATLGGGVSVGQFSAIGLGANILHGRSVGQQCVLGAGATLTRDLPDFVVGYGVPARPVRSRVAGERYL